MELVKVGAGVLNQTPLAWATNRKNIIGSIEDARREEVTLLCLPELCVTGYGCEDAFLSKDVLDRAWKSLVEIAKSTRGMAVSVGLPLYFEKGIYNANALCVDGQIKGIVCKRYLAGDGIHYEPRWFKPWPAGMQSTIERDGFSIPVGDLHFDVGGLRVGYEICEDAWVAHRPGSELAVHGVDVIFNPSASHFAFGKIGVRERLVVEGSRAFGVAYVYANLLGNEAGRAIYDGGALIAMGGTLVAAGPRFSFRDRLLTTAVFDVGRARMGQARTFSFRPDPKPLGPERVRVEFIWPPRTPIAAAPLERAAWERGSHVKEEEFARAEALALFDFLRKSHCQGFALSLSGGADSSCVASLIRMMVELSSKELGVDGARARLGHIPAMATANNLSDMMRILLVCAYQSTENSGSVTHNAARTIANAVGADWLDFNVDPLFKGYVNMVGQAMGRTLDWKTDDIALQNIQARVRAPGIWMVANLRNALLLATSNRSEAAVGYATMDGDTCGGLSPIAGIDKAYLRRWLRWMETIGPEGASPIAALSVVNQQQPTAELRPQAASQTDEEDLMPYDLLDFVERAAIRDKRSPLEIMGLLRVDFPQYGDGQLAIWLERFFRLWCRNQWKRERYAPSFHLDDENLDPKTWCRFPILSGGYEEELADLRASVGR